MSDLNSGGARAGGAAQPGFHLPLRAKPHTLEFCVNNAEFGAAQVAELLRAEFPALTVKAWRCLGHCHYCARAPFIVLDDDLIEGERPEDLLTAVRAVLRRKQRGFPHKDETR